MREVVIWKIYIEYKTGQKNTYIYVGKSPSRTKKYKEYELEFNTSMEVEAFGYKKVSDI